MTALIFRQCQIQKYSDALSEYVHTLEGLIPEEHSAVIEPRVNNTMTSLSVNENNFVAILSLPSNDATFPVGVSWESIDAYPCLYSGSVYDGSLVIGTTSQRGQFDFVKDVSVGNKVYLTDMTGNRFSYEVADIQYSDHADNQTLASDPHDLTIFVKNVYAFEYIIIRCSSQGS